MMKNYILFDDNAAMTLLPLTYGKPIAELRTGIYSFKERWELFLKEEISYNTQDYLQDKYPIRLAENSIYINAGIIASAEIYKQINTLSTGECLVNSTSDRIIAFCPAKAKIYSLEEINAIANNFSVKQVDVEVKILQFPWEIFSWNKEVIESDFPLITEGRTSASLNNTNTLIGNNPIFIEKTAKINATVINTENGPVYIGENAEIMEGSLIRGPFVMGENAVLKMNSKMYGATTIGHGCKVGGEINNSVFTANSNKAHDGFIGNAVIGEWCNLGADTNNSNLKNTYEEVKLWSFVEDKFVKTGLQFCGLIMGDHSKSSINTMFNTGTVIGFSSNLFGEGFHRNFVPSFTWGGHRKYSAYQLDKAIKTAKLVLERRGIPFTEADEKIFVEIFKKSADYRTF